MFLYDVLKREKIIPFIKGRFLVDFIVKNVSNT
jgi:hypothetical protein